VWGITLNTMFHMTNDSHLFRTRERLEADGWRLEGNIFRNAGAEYLPLYEGKLTRPFDHRAGTFEGVSAAEATKGNEREATAEEKNQPLLSACPRWWVKQRDVLQKYGT
jgi:hypothetical protein